MRFLLAVLFFASPPAVADGWPSRPIKLVVPLQPGTGLDVVGRLLAPDLAERFGQPVVVENRPGAGDNIAMASVAQAPADGHTLLLATTALAVNPYLYESLSYDPEKDFVPVAQVGTSHFVLAARPDLRARTAAELIALAKAKPQSLTCGQSVGATLIACAWLNSAAGIELTVVPFKSGIQALNEVVAGRLDLVFGYFPSLAAHVQAGRLVLLASTASSGDKAARDGPRPLAETLPGFELLSWYGFVVRSGTPPDILQRLEYEIADSLKQPQMRGKLERYDYDYAPSAVFAERIRESRERYGRVIRQAGIRPM